MKKLVLLSLVCLVLAISLSVRAATGSPQSTAVTPTTGMSPTVTRAVALTSTPLTATVNMPTPASASFTPGMVPNFDHIILIVLENEYSQNVIGSPQMPNFNALAAKNVLLSNYSAITHPSLPNYLALISGSVQNISDDCTDCFVQAPSLPDEIEASGRTWKAYFEDMPSPCFIGNKKPYQQIFNPFIYFLSIRLDAVRCNNSVVPLTQLDSDLASGQLPDFVYIAPNVCHSGHSCSATTADDWLGGMIARLRGSPALGANSLLIVTFDEGTQRSVPVLTRGEVATLLISPLAQHGLNDSTAYSHYSLLKTILYAWHLPALGDTELATTNVIIQPWVDQMGQIYPRELTPGP